MLTINSKEKYYSYYNFKKGQCLILYRYTVYTFLHFFSIANDMLWLVNGIDEYNLI